MGQMAKFFVMWSQSLELVNTVVSNKKREITFESASTLEFFLFIIKTNKQKTTITKDFGNSND